MDYKNKYLKCKKKYLQIKTKLFVNELKKLYPSCKHDLNLLNNYANYKITYGEMDYDGFDSIINFPDLSNYSFESFIDIGSGRGKICLYASSMTSIKKSIGIELVKERHDDALNLKSQLSMYPEILKVNFINGDFFDYNFSNFNLTNVLVWISNLCFEQETTNKLFIKLLDELPSKTIIACSKQHMIDNLKIKKIGEISIKMSWSNNSMIYLYQIN